METTITLSNDGVSGVINEIKAIVGRPGTTRSKIRIKHRKLDDYEKITKLLDSFGFNEDDLLSLLSSLTLSDYHNTEITAEKCQLHSFIVRLEKITYVKVEFIISPHDGQDMIQLISFHEPIIN
jgi:hypothetical protein